MITKRLFDLFLTVPALVILSPLFVAIALCIKFDSPGPAFFRQERVGRFGRQFHIYKFRTMCVDAETKGHQITVGKDPRITRAGRFFRKYKVDELPQLLNVLFGDMSLVGPRPEVPRYVALYPPAVREAVLSVPPGITDYASIKYRDENTILSLAEDPEKAYIEEIMPVKLRYYERYVAERTLFIDFKIMLETIKAVIIA